jgi:hypothetical protein
MTETGTQPMSRAHPRESRPRLHKLRKGRDRCGARTRDGGECMAPAIAGGVRCRRHGGGTPAAQIAAKHFLLLEARWNAALEWEQVKDTWRRYDAMGRYSRAEEALAEYEAKLERLAWLRAEVRRLKAG